MGGHHVAGGFVIDQSGRVWGAKANQDIVLPGQKLLFQFVVGGVGFGKVHIQNARFLDAAQTEQAVFPKIAVFGPFCLFSGCDQPCSYVRNVF